MSRAGAIGIVLLAAGAAARYGSPKQVLMVDGQPLVRRMALAALQVSPQVAVVTGAHREFVEPALAGLALDMVHHADWPVGMGASLAFGVRHAMARDDRPAALIVMLCDQPAVGTAQLQALAQAAAQAPGCIVAADYGNGVQGAPCLFPAHCFDELAALHGAEGARRVLARHAGNVRAVLMPEAGLDIDTPADYRRWRTGSTV